MSAAAARKLPPGVRRAPSGLLEIEVSWDQFEVIARAGNGSHRLWKPTRKALARMLDAQTLAIIDAEVARGHDPGFVPRKLNAPRTQTVPDRSATERIPRSTPARRGGGGAL